MAPNIRRMRPSRLSSSTVDTKPPGQAGRAGASRPRIFSRSIVPEDKQPRLADDPGRARPRACKDDGPHPLLGKGVADLVQEKPSGSIQVRHDMVKKPDQEHGSRVFASLLRVLEQFVESLEVIPPVGHVKDKV